MERVRSGACVQSGGGEHMDVCVGEVWKERCENEIEQAECVRSEAERCA